MCVYVCMYICSIPRAAGFPGGSSSEEPACQCRRHKRPWVAKILSRKAQQATHSSILAWRIPWRAMIHRVTKSQTRKKLISTYQGQLTFNVPGLFLVYTEYIHADIEQIYAQNGKHIREYRVELNSSYLPNLFIQIQIYYMFSTGIVPLVPQI